jgi:glycosyltransferase involved in cell wall biosynthesis
VCHVISGYFRNDARIFLRQCKSLKKYGFDVSILTNDGEPDEEIDGIKIFDCRKSWSRVKTLLMAKQQFLHSAISIEADVYQLHSPELLPLGVALKRLGKKVVYDAHEDMPRHILEKEWLPPLSRAAVSRAFENYMLRTLSQYDDIISPHSHVVTDFQKRIGKGTLIANFPLISADLASTQSHYSARPPLLCYSGTVYAYSNQEEIVEALSRFEDIQYKIAGYIDEAHAERLKAMPAGQKVTALGRLSRSALHEFYQTARVGMVVYDYKLNLGGKLGSYGTNKIFEYMEAGLPVICTDYILWKDIVDRYDCGICVAPGKPDEIADAIDYLLRDSHRAYRMGQNGRSAVLKEFHWGSEEAKYVGLFERLFDQRRAENII